jgi:hypothetical protein
MKPGCGMDPERFIEPDVIYVSNESPVDTVKPGRINQTCLDTECPLGNAESSVCSRDISPF